MKHHLSTSSKQSINLLSVALFVFVGLLLLIPSESAFALCDLEGYVYLFEPYPSTDSTLASCGFVRLLDSTRTVIDSCCLDINLDYSFLDLPNGDYNVEVVCAKKRSTFHDGCYGFSYYGSDRVTISGEPYLRKEMYLASYSGPESTHCCHGCPCHDVLPE